MDLNSITFVTCWLKIDRPPTVKYKEFGQEIIEANINLVLFITPEFIPLLEIPEQRKHRIILKEITTLTYQTPEILEKYKYCKTTQHDKFTPLYYVVCWNKFIFLNQVCHENPFNTPLIAWIDYGICRILNWCWDISPKPPYVINTALIQDIYPALKFTELFIDKVRCCNNNLLMDHNDPEFFTKERSFVAAGFFLGSIKGMSKVCDLFDLELHYILEENNYVPEEHIFGYLISKYPDLFSLYCGWHCDLFRNFFRIKCRYWLMEHMIEDYKIQNRISTGRYVIKYIHQSLLFGSSLHVHLMMRFIGNAITYDYKCMEITHLFLSLYNNCPQFKEITDKNADFLRDTFQNSVIGKIPSTEISVYIYIPHPKGHQLYENLITMLSKKFWVIVYTDDNYEFCNIIKCNPSYQKNNNNFTEAFTFVTTGSIQDQSEIYSLIVKYIS